MGTEFELKYRADAETLSAVRREIPGAEVVLQMQTTYYDSPDGKLSALRWTLRRRLENGKSICTLKTPGDGITRQEWEVETDNITDAISKLCKLGCPSELPALVANGLIPTCGARFTRIAKTLRIENALLEIALDTGVLTGGGREAPLCELEVELKEGSETACRVFAENLAARFGLVPEPDAKLRRALTLYRG